MVYESDFYTVRRPYSRPTITSYSVTGCRPILSMRNYIAPSGTHSRVRLSVLMGELNRIQNRSRPHWSRVPMEDFLCSRPLVSFDDEAKHIRAAADRLLRYVYTRVPHRTSHLPVRVITTYDRYAPEGRYTSSYFGTVPDDILSMSYYYDPARVTIGRGHLSCVSYAGGRGYPRRKHLYSDEYRDINDEIKFRSYYNKIMNPKRTEDALLLPTGFASRLLLADRYLTGPDEGRAIIFKTKLTKPATDTSYVKDKPKDKPSKKEKVKRSATLDDTSAAANWTDYQETQPKTETVWMKTEDVKPNSEGIFQESPAPSWAPEETPVKEKRKKSLSKKKSVDEFKSDAAPEITSRKSSYATEAAPSLTRQPSQPSDLTPSLSRQTSQTGTTSLSRQLSQKVEPEEEPAPKPEEEPTPTLSRQLSQTSVKSISRQASQKIEAEEEAAPLLSGESEDEPATQPKSLSRQTSQRVEPEEEAPPAQSEPEKETTPPPEEPEEDPADTPIVQSVVEPEETAKETAVEAVTLSLSRKASSTSEAAPAPASRKASVASEVQATTPSISRQESVTAETLAETVQEAPVNDEPSAETVEAEPEVSKLTDDLNAVNDTREELETEIEKISVEEPEKEIAQSQEEESDEVALNGLADSTDVKEGIVQVEEEYVSKTSSIEVKSSSYQENIVTSEQSEDEGHTEEADVSNTAISPEPLVEEPTSPF